MVCGIAISLLGAGVLASCSDDDDDDNNKKIAILLAMQNNKKKSTSNPETPTGGSGQEGNNEQQENQDITTNENGEIVGGGVTEDGEIIEIPDSQEGLKPFTMVNVGDMKTETFNSTKIANNMKIVAAEDATITIDENGTTLNKVKYTKRLKLGGTGSKTARNVTLYVGPNVKGVLTVILASSSSSGTGRKLMANDTQVGEAPTKIGTLTAQVQGDADGYIALYSSESGINLYQIAFDTGNAGTGTTAGGTAGELKSNVSEKQKPILDNTALAPTYDNGIKVGKRTNLRDIDISTIANALYVSPTGTPAGTGTKESPLDIATAVTLVTPGGAVILQSGTYELSTTLTIAETNNGLETARKYILPEDKNGAILDFSRQPTADTSRGLQLNGSYWHIYGITCYNAGDNGMYVTGNNNIVERCIFQANQDTGLQIARRASNLSDKKDWPHDNLILNCTSFDNKDDKTGENADGFASKLTCGDGNEFNGCISFANCDDGWDLYAKPATGPIGVVKILNCMSLQNGKTTTGAKYASGDMNGFKLGGSNNQCPTPHIVKNCISFSNGKDGFTDNGNGGALDVSNCSAYGNVNSNFNFYRTFEGKFDKLIGSTNISPAQNDKFGDAEVASTISNSVYLVDKKKKSYYHVEAAASITNGAKVGTAVSDPSGDFVSTTPPTMDYTLDGKCRNVDGTINVSGYLEVKAGSAYAGYGAKFGTQALEVIPVTLITE